MQRMNDARESLESNPIEIMTSPSDECASGKCDGTGWLWFKNWSRLNMRDGYNEEGEWVDESLRAEWMEKCVCHDQLVKQREVDKKIDLSGIPPIFKDSTVQSFRIEKYKLEESKELAKVARKAAANYVTNFELMRESGKGLYFYSEVKGSGKTRLACSIANAIVNMYGMDIAFIKSSDLMSQVYKTMNKNSETTRSEIIEIFRKVELLVIDDLALKDASEFEEGVFYDITDYRLEHKKTTIFTSNVKISDLDKTYPGGRIDQRINKMTLEIYMPEESIRDEEADEENAALEEILLRG